MTPETKAILILLLTATIWAVGCYRLIKWLDLRWKRKQEKWIAAVSVMAVLITACVVLNLLITAFDIFFFSYFNL